MGKDNNTARDAASPNRKRRRLRGLGIAAGSVAGLLLVLMTVLQVLMSPSVMKSIVEKIAADTERDHYLTSKEAKEYGLIDEVVSRSKSAE